MKHEGQPTVIFAKTVKGYGMGEAGEAMNTTHNTKKMTTEQLIAFCDRFAIPIPKNNNPGKKKNNISGSISAMSNIIFTP